MKRIERVLMSLLDADWSTAAEIAKRCELPYRDAKETVRYASKIGLAGGVQCGRECIYWIEPAGVEKLMAVLDRSAERQAQLDARREYRRQYRAELRERARQLPVRVSSLANHLGAAWR